MIDPNLMSGIIGAAAGLIGAFGGAAVGGWISWKIAHRQLQISTDQKKLENVFNLHKDFNSESCHDSRTKAGKLLWELTDSTFNDMYKVDATSGYVHFWIVLNFYRRLWLAVKHKQVDERYVAELFGATFIWWWDNCFQSKLPSTWESHRDINDLRAWMEEHTSREEFIRWQQMARIDRETNLPTVENKTLPSAEVKAQVDAVVSHALPTNTLVSE
ncbi:MAG: hypothetical protein MOB07_02725 [Acidobacteria bacterium]|nr:hypothetical protein [Acidobacteriota bacterium]